MNCKRNFKHLNNFFSFQLKRLLSHIYVPKNVESVVLFSSEYFIFTQMCFTNTLTSVHNGNSFALLVSRHRGWGRMEKVNKQRGRIKNCCWSLVPPGPQGCCIDPFMQLGFFFPPGFIAEFQYGGKEGVAALSPIRQRRSAVSQPPYWLKHVDKVSTIDFFFSPPPHRWKGGRVQDAFPAETRENGQWWLWKGYRKRECVKMSEKISFWLKDHKLCTCKASSS